MVTKLLVRGTHSRRTHCQWVLRRARQLPVEPLPPHVPITLVHRPQRGEVVALGIRNVEGRSVTAQLQEATTQHTSPDRQDCLQQTWGLS